MLNIQTGWRNRSSTSLFSAVVRRLGTRSPKETLTWCGWAFNISKLKIMRRLLWRCWKDGCLNHHHHQQRKKRRSMCRCQWWRWQEGLDRGGSSIWKISCTWICEQSERGNMVSLLKSPLLFIMGCQISSRYNKSITQTNKIVPSATQVSVNSPRPFLIFHPQLHDNFMENLKLNFDTCTKIKM